MLLTFWLIPTGYSVANVQKIITSAIFKSLQDREHQPEINAGYQDTALDFMNNILDEWRDKIPYKNAITFTTVESLLNTTFVEIDAIQYVISTNIPFWLQEKSLSEFLQLQNVIDLKSFPAIYYFDQLSQSVDIFPLPSNTDYKFIVQGRIAQIELDIFDEIPANMPRFMQDALIFELAYRLSIEYGRIWSDKKEERRMALLKALIQKKEIDLSQDRNIDFGTPGLMQRAPFPTWFYLSGGGQ